jgi:hypothetical protein
VEDKKKIVIVRIEMDPQDYKDAKELCGFTHQDIVEMIADQGVSGLNNYVGHQDNWVE